MLLFVNVWKVITELVKINEIGYYSHRTCFVYVKISNVYALYRNCRDSV